MANVNNELAGRQKVSIHQNIFEADFEYGLQPLRWQSLTYGSGNILSAPGSGGVLMTVGTAAGDIALRQSRPYHRYQPGKTMYMATNVNFGGTVTGQRQRVGFFDDGNGIFFEQGDPNNGNPAGIYCVIRSDINGTPTDTRIDYQNWTDEDNIRGTINWSNVQMLFIEYAWYGAGGLRWGVLIDGVPHILHHQKTGNALTQPWCRTGNLPVRYELRNLAAVATGATFYHYGVSVLVDGGQDKQRGFTYTYGMALGTPTRTVAAGTTRFPLFSMQYRPMGTQEYTQAGAAITGSPTTTTMTVAGTPWTAGQWVGRYVFFPGTGAAGLGSLGRITANTTNTLTYCDPVRSSPQDGVNVGITTAPVAGASYIIGLVNRGLVLPQSMTLYSTALCQVEVIASTPGNPVVLTGSAFVAENTLGSPNSFTNRDVSATALSGGEVVYKVSAPAGGSGLQTIDLSFLFPLYNIIQGNLPDILTIAVTTATGVAANVGVDIVGQEQMS